MGALESRQASFDTAATRPAQDDVKVLKVMQDQQVKNIDVILSSRPQVGVSKDA